MRLICLAADGVYLLPVSPPVTVGSYPTRFTLTSNAGGFVSVALSLGLGIDDFSREPPITYSRLSLTTVMLCAVRTFLSIKSDHPVISAFIIILNFAYFSTYEARWLSSALLTSISARVFWALGTCLKVTSWLWIY